MRIETLDAKGRRSHYRTTSESLVFYMILANGLYQLVMLGGQDGWTLQHLVGDFFTVLLLWGVGAVGSSIFGYFRHRYLKSVSHNTPQDLLDLVSTQAALISIKRPPRLERLLWNLNVSCFVSQLGSPRVYVTGGFVVFSRRCPKLASSMLLHELSHVKNGDTIVLRFFNYAFTFLLLATAMGVANSHPNQFLLHIAAVAFVIPLVRRREYLADLTALCASPAPGAYMVTLAQSSHGSRNLFHPPTNRRIQAIISSNPMLRCNLLVVLILLVNIASSSYQTIMAFSRYTDPSNDPYDLRLGPAYSLTIAGAVVLMLLVGVLAELRRGFTAKIPVPAALKISTLATANGEYQNAITALGLDDQSKLFSEEAHFAEEAITELDARESGDRERSWSFVNIRRPVALLWKYKPRLAGWVSVLVLMSLAIETLSNGPFSSHRYRVFSLGAREPAIYRKSMGEIISPSRLLLMPNHQAITNETYVPEQSFEEESGKCFLASCLFGGPIWLAPLKENPPMALFTGDQYRAIDVSSDSEFLFAGTTLIPKHIGIRQTKPPDMEFENDANFSDETLVITKLDGPKVVDIVPGVGTITGVDLSRDGTLAVARFDVKAGSSVSVRRPGEAAHHLKLPLGVKNEVISNVRLRGKDLVYFATRLAEPDVRRGSGRLCSADVNQSPPGSCSDPFDAERVVISRDGGSLAFVRDRNPGWPEVVVMSTDRDKVSYTLNPECSVERLSVEAAHKLIAVGCYDFSVASYYLRIFNYSKQKELSVIRMESTPSELSFSPDGDYLVATWDETAVVWNSGAWSSWRFWHLAPASVPMRIVRFFSPAFLAGKPFPR